METYAADARFPFSALVLGSPRPIQGGAHFTQASLGPGRPLYVQLPRCTFKQGIVTTKRGCYCDLMYDKGQAEGLVDWLLALESAAQEQIYKQRETWFHTELSRDDIETMLTPMSRLYRSGRSILIRTQLRLDKSSGKPACTVYDEREASLDLDSINEDPEVTVIPLILIDGVKFSSRSFEIDVRLVQFMVLDPRPEPAAACLIRREDATGLVSASGTPAQEEEERTSGDPEPAPPETLIRPPEVGFSPGESTCEEASVVADKGCDDPVPPSASGAAKDAVSPSKDETSILPINGDDVDDGSSDSPPEAAGDVDEPTPADGLTEVSVAVGADEACMTLRKPDEVYRDIYRSARRKARQMRAAAIAALMEAQEIKARYRLEDLDESEEDESAGESPGAQAE